MNLAKGEHNCHFCGKTYPWKAALDKHIEKQHQVCPIVHLPSFCNYNQWFRMVRVMEICRGKGPQWFIMTNNSEKKWLLMQKPPQGKRQKRGEIASALHLYLTHNSCCRFDLSESTIRMWLRKSDGLDYRGPSYNRLHSDRVPFQGTLQVLLSLFTFLCIPIDHIF